jgi:hypothetical protein
MRLLSINEDPAFVLTILPSLDVERRWINCYNLKTAHLPTATPGVNLAEPGETQFPVHGLNPRLDLKKQRLFTVGPKGPSSAC